MKKQERKKVQRHKPFEESFDAKEYYSTACIEQKLLHMHHNPVKGKWNLANDFAMYEHSRAGFYYSTGANMCETITSTDDTQQEIAEQTNPGLSPQS